LRHKEQNSVESIGYATFFLNRCNRSGILSGGVIGGLKQEGIWKMDARFPRRQLANKIEAIANKRDRIKVTNYDAEKLLKSIRERKKKKSFVYCDPPYVKKSEKLYLNHYNYEDHKRIAEIIQSINDTFWTVSYDYNDYIFNLYKERNSFAYNLQYNASKVYLGKELFIFSDALSVPSESDILSIDKALKKTIA
jgi:DNA adenine methylase